MLLSYPHLLPICLLLGGLPSYLGARRSQISVQYIYIPIWHLSSVPFISPPFFTTTLLFVIQSLFTPFLSRSSSSLQPTEMSRHTECATPQQNVEQRPLVILPGCACKHTHCLIIHYPRTLIRSVLDFGTSNRTDVPTVGVRVTYL